MAKVTLQKSERIEAHPETGERIEVTDFSRGLLRREEKKFQTLNAMFAALASPSPRKNFENYCDRLRVDLEGKGLPSDRQPWWIKKEGEDWKEATPLPNPLIKSAHWTKRLEELTECLSEERAAGELLQALTDLLGRPGIDKYLEPIGRVVHRHCMLVLSGHINDLANQGLKGRRARASGPIAKRANAVKKAKIIISCALDFWAAHPEFRDIASTTARKIMADVNERLRSENLLSHGKEGLSDTRIAAYIREKDTGTDFLD